VVTHVDTRVVDFTTDIVWVAFESSDASMNLKQRLKRRFSIATCTPAELAMHDRWEPKAVILDFNHITSMGVRLVLKLKRLHVSVPVILLTESSSEQLVIWAFRAGVWDYYIKPLSDREQDRIESRLQRLLQILDSNVERRQSLCLSEEFQVSESCPDARASRRLMPAVMIIEKNYSSKITETELAESCQLSVHHFSRLFKQAMGMTLQSYIIERRLQEAEKLLREGVHQVSAVAFSVGFNDPSYFGKVFKRAYDMTPSQYQEQLMGQVPADDKPDDPDVDELDMAQDA